MADRNQKEQRLAKALAKENNLKYTAALAIIRGEKTLEQQLQNPNTKKT